MPPPIRLIALSTFVLVPGAWLGGWVWKKVTPLLQEKGHRVYPVTLTGTGNRVHLASKDVGMETAIQDVMSIIEYNDLDDIVLVGHSFAGKVVAPVAERAHKKVEMIGKDVQGADREWMLAKATPWPVRHAADPISLSEKFDAVKSAYIFCTGSGDPVDEIVAGKWGRLEGPYKIIDTGHWPMITKPKELVEDMLALTGS